jgi:hypothetical protein
MPCVPNFVLQYLGRVDPIVRHDRLVGIVRAGGDKAKIGLLRRWSQSGRGNQDDVFGPLVERSRCRCRCRR